MCLINTHIKGKHIDRFSFFGIPSTQENFLMQCLFCRKLFKTNEE